MIYKKYLLALLVIITTLAFPVVTLASDISNAIYTGIIAITNNGTANTTVTTNLTLSSPELISAYDIDNDFSEVAIHDQYGADVRFMPGYLTNPWMIYTPSIGDNEIQYYPLYVGDSSLNSTKYMFINSADITDAPSMELSDNYTIKVDNVRLVSSANSNIVVKASAFSLTYNYGGSGNLTFYAVAGGGVLTHALGLGEYDIEVRVNPSTSTTEYALRPEAEGDESALSSTGGVNHYTEVDESEPDENTTWVAKGGLAPPSWARDLYEIPTATFTSVNKITGYARCRWGGGIGGVKFAIKTGGIVYESSVINITGDWTNYSYEWATNPNTGLAWTQADIDDLQIGVSLVGGMTGMNYSSLCTQCYVVVNGTVAAVGGQLLVDGIPIATTAVNMNIGDNDAVVILGSGVTAYIGEVLLQHDGTDRCLINWEYGATFTDDSGNGNDATPSFKTSGTDLDITAALLSFEPIDTAIPPAYAVTDPQNFYDDNVTMSGQFTTGNISTTGGPPGFALVNDLATAGDVPNIWLFGILALCLSIGSHLFWIWMQRRFSFRSLWPFFITGAFIFGMFIALGGTVKVFDFWMMVFYIVIFICVMVMSRHTEVGGNVSTHGMIGFAAQSWIGLTMINKMLEASFVGATETAWINNFAFTQHFKIFNMFSIPVLNLDFWTKGIPSLFRWDYSFFGGNAQMFQYLLYSLTAVVAFIVFGIVIGMLYNFFTGR